jgi:hypothetical protein
MTSRRHIREAMRDINAGPIGGEGGDLERTTRSARRICSAM